MLKCELPQITTYSGTTTTNYKKCPTLRDGGIAPIANEVLKKTCGAERVRPVYPGFLAVTFHELESIMTPFGR
jgi:hypothetical protein